MGDDPEGRSRRGTVNSNKSEKYSPDVPDGYFGVADMFFGA